MSLFSKINAVSRGDSNGRCYLRIAVHDSTFLSADYRRRFAWSRTYCVAVQPEDAPARIAVSDYTCVS